ncbi:hypothetical protein ACIO3O_37010 [Streptomyces sp. NPDC087440]|uniref:hypothetical protein n=1 Tax=Streptomyces sp. NPDC087440 TaxID=3365790 RepID=UPI0038220B13
MSVLPRTTPEKFTEQLSAALTAAGATYGGIKPGTRVTHCFTGPDGVTWEFTYLGQHAGEPDWRMTGPRGHEHGVWVGTEDAAARIIALPAPEPEPVPGDPHPGGPRTHLGFDVPDFIRAGWDTLLGEGWRWGVVSAVGKLPANRPR